LGGEAGESCGEADAERNSVSCGLSRAASKSSAVRRDLADEVDMRGTGEGPLATVTGGWELIARDWEAVA
jgi:hypothetical protein